MAGEGACVPTVCCNGAPHRMQNTPPAAFSFPQLGQVIALFSIQSPAHTVAARQAERGHAMARPYARTHSQAAPIHASAPVAFHSPVRADSITASHTFCVCSALRKSGCVGLPDSTPCTKSASAFKNVCS